jgi:hypothetical protein
MLARRRREARWRDRRIGKAALCPGYPQEALSAILLRHARLYAGHLA